MLPAVDHSRVKLENTENDYINASLVVMEEAQRSYILTQVSPGLLDFRNDSGLIDSFSINCLITTNRTTTQ